MCKIVGERYCKFGGDICIGSEYIARNERGLEIPPSGTRVLKVKNYIGKGQNAKIRLK